MVFDQSHLICPVGSGGRKPTSLQIRRNPIRQNINHKDIRAADDSEELIGILTAISVVSKRLARKLTATSYQSNYKAEYECPLRQEGETMYLYEINAEILRLTNEIVFDEETSEILCDIDAIEQQIMALQMEKKPILIWLAKLVLNTRSEAAAIKAEESRLKKRREHLKKKNERLMKIIDRECAGEKTDLGITIVSYRKSEPLEVIVPATALQ